MVKSAGPQYAPSFPEPKTCLWVYWYWQLLGHRVQQTQQAEKMGWHSGLKRSKTGKLVNLARSDRMEQSTGGQETRLESQRNRAVISTRQIDWQASVHKDIQALSADSCPSSDQWWLKAFFFFFLFWSKVISLRQTQQIGMFFSAVRWKLLSTKMVFVSSNLKGHVLLKVCQTCLINYATRIDK